MSQYMMRFILGIGMLEMQIKNKELIYPINSRPNNQEIFVFTNNYISSIHLYFF